jgi:sec-independent protein translocase protein TatC
MAFTIAFTFGFILASPVVFWQLWKFISPALHARERKAVRSMVWAMVGLFLVGVAFAYWVVAPLSIQFFTTFSLSKSITNIPTIQNYIGMLTSFVLWTGVSFELPVIAVLLTRLGLLGPGFLRQYRKHAYVVILIIAAIITPPDVTSQILVTLPLVILYEGSIFLSARTQRRQEQPATAATTR